MRELGGCKVFAPNEHSDHHVGSEDSSCFYFGATSLDPLAQRLISARKEMVCRAARIEVTDKEDVLHAHAGATVVFVASGSGRFKTIAGDVGVRAGDWIVVPPDTPHLSVADAHTVMHEMVVYIGASDDRQDSYPVARKTV